MRVKILDTAEFLFNKAISEYYANKQENFYKYSSLEYIFYQKSIIDSNQWDMEDKIRSKKIDPKEALEIKRKIDKLNSQRVELIEAMDRYFVLNYVSKNRKDTAKLNTESLGMALDRLSIIILKTYHMKKAIDRLNNDKEILQDCKKKLKILYEQKQDLKQSITELIEDIKNGDKYIKLYHQIKMYNNSKLNPVLFKESKE